MKEIVNVYLVGDSTVAKFNDAYYYPRYGYGTMLPLYFKENVLIHNLAMSGRSSLSYIKEKNYEFLKNNLKKGDYLVIGFGHNDEKYDDLARFSSAKEDLNTKGSFSYNLNEYYLKLALSKNASPILATPVCRASVNNDYNGVDGHNTIYGNYEKAIIELGKKTNTTVIDLTEKTRELYQAIGYDKAINFHAWTTSNKANVDVTHLNILGAKMVSFFFAQELLKSSSGLKEWVKEDITKPTLKDLVVNPNYVEYVYAPFNTKTYEAKTWTDIQKEGWFGTAFGDCDGTPTNNGNGFMAYEEDNSFIVGQQAGSSKGKISKKTEGIAAIFHQVSSKYNFNIKVDGKILSRKTIQGAGFGLMLRDDIYTEQAMSDNSILSNYVAAGIYNLDDTTASVLYVRENKKLFDEGNFITPYEEGDSFSLEIDRLGQVVKTKITFKDKEYAATYTDFDFFAIDNEYMYILLYATRGSVVKYTHLDFKITGEAIKA